MRGEASAFRGEKEKTKFHVSRKRVLFKGKWKIRSFTCCFSIGVSREIAIMEKTLDAFLGNHHGELQ